MKRKKKNLKFYMVFMVAKISVTDELDKENFYLLFIVIIKVSAQQQ